jgi:hypothetical protein
LAREALLTAKHFQGMGPQAVRGGPWCRKTLPPADRKELESVTVPPQLLPFVGLRASSRVVRLRSIWLASLIASSLGTLTGQLCCQPKNHLAVRAEAGRVDAAAKAAVVASLDMHTARPKACGMGTRSLPRISGATDRCKLERNICTTTGQRRSDGTQSRARPFHRLLLTPLARHGSIVNDMSMWPSVGMCPVSIAMPASLR